MNDSQSITTALWAMIFVQTIGAVDLPGRGSRKLPAPRTYVIVIVAMGILQLVADAGYSRAAKAMAWLTVLAAAVLGPFGPRFVNFLRNVATNFTVNPTAVAPQNVPPPTTSPGRITKPGVPVPGLGGIGHRNTP